MERQVLDTEFMSRALELARKGLYTASPNPRVGCVIVNDGGEIVGEGYHRKTGEPHAEIVALRDAGAAASACSVYVTLEPCSHTGLTGPCTEALIKAGVKEVIYGFEDPNPLVAGQGILMLREAGIEVRGPVLEDAAIELNKGFCKRMRTGLPWVTCKLAMSLDGRTAMASGESKWITGPAAREEVQYLRAQNCALISGIGTVLLDNPHLNARADGIERQPLRVVVDSQLRTPTDAELFKSAGEVLLVNALSNPTYAREEVSVLSMPGKNRNVDLHALLQWLAEHKKCNEVLIEAGATLSGALMAAGLIDELVVYMAAKIMGKDARPLFDISINSMAGQLPLSIRDIRAIGNDWRITAVPDPED